MKRNALVLIVMSLLMTTPLWAAKNYKELKRTCQLQRDYYLYLPATLDKNRTYHLVVGVHGYRGSARGAAGIANWAKRDDCIVLGPQFPHQGYQYLQAQAGEQLVQIIAALKKEYRLYDKAFLWGHSGGGQFTHRFAMKHPELVAGCSSHAAGTWLTGDYPPASQDVQPSPKANSVVFAIHCGMKDTRKSFSQCPLGRLDWAKKFAGKLYAGGFTFKEMYHPNIGHGVNQNAWKLTHECYFLSTMGMDIKEAAMVVKAETSIRKAIATKNKSTAVRGIKALRKLAASKPKPLPKETNPSNAPARQGHAVRDAAGWYVPKAQADARTKRRAAYLTDLADHLEAQLTGKPLPAKQAPAPTTPNPKPAVPTTKPAPADPESAARFCTKCGKKATGGKFCTGCGKVLPEAATPKPAPKPPAAKFCTKCGTKL